MSSIMSAAGSCGCAIQTQDPAGVHRAAWFGTRRQAGRSRQVGAVRRHPGARSRLRTCSATSSTFESPAEVRSCSAARPQAAGDRGRATGSGSSSATPVAERDLPHPPAPFCQGGTARHGTIVALDFNRAYNPPCACNPSYLSSAAAAEPAGAARPGGRAGLPRGIKRPGASARRPRRWRQRARVADRDVACPRTGAHPARSFPAAIPDPRGARRRGGLRHRRRLGARPPLRRRTRRS